MGAFCDAYEKLEEADIADVDVEDPEALQAALEDTRPLIDDLADAAPEEIRAEVDGAIEFYDEIFAILEKYDYDLNRILEEGTPEELALLQQLGSASAGQPGNPDLDAVEEYAVENCEGVEDSDGKLSKAGSAIG